MNLDPDRIVSVLQELEAEQRELLIRIEMHSSHISLMQRTEDKQEADHEENLLSMYEQAGVIMPDAIRKRFENVRTFRASISANRKAILADQIESHIEKLASCQQRLRTLKSLKHEAKAMLAHAGKEGVGVNEAEARLVEVPVGFALALP